MTGSDPVRVWRGDRSAKLIDVVGCHESDIATELATYGAVLFRGFPRITDHEFKSTLTRFGGPALEYSERSSPRREISDRVYSSTEYPQDQEIFFHNENSYQVAWPKVLGFVCRQAAASGGQTQVTDCRSVLAAIHDNVLAEFASHGWAYVRNFHRRLGLPWQEVFGASERSTVDDYCRAHRLQAEWIGSSRLRVRSDSRPVVYVHPVTGEKVWFNHAAFFHYSTLPTEISEALYEGMEPEDLPSNSYLGDGRAISNETIEAVRQAYNAGSVSVDWEPDDVLVIDNMLMAHSRRPFTGNRRISVAMAGLTEAKDIDGR